MFKKLLAAVMLTVPLCVNAQTREWTDDEKLLGTASGVLIASDWLLTRDMIKNHSGKYFELNPLLGPTPSLGELNRHFLMFTPLLYFTVNHFEGQRKNLLATFVIIETLNISHMYSIGLRFSF